MNYNNLVVVDGSNFLYRAYYSTSKVNLHNSKNMPTGAIKVFINMLLKLLKTYKNSRFIVVFDSSSKSFRNTLYPDYKNNRKPMPDDLKIQIHIIHDFIKSLGMNILIVDGVEADDVIGTIAAVVSKSSCSLIIASGDKDLTYLVNDKVSVVDTMNGVVLNKEEVTKKFGVPPHLIRDYLALRGDSSDNIPGMPGIGDKIAALLLNTIGDIDTIFSNLDVVENLNFRGAKTFAKKFIENKDIVFLSRELATIKLDVILPIDIFNLTDIKPSLDSLKKIYTECEFSDFNKLKDFILPYLQDSESFTTENDSEKELCNKEISYKLISDEQSLKQFYNQVCDFKTTSFYILCKSTNIFDFTVYGVSFFVNGMSYYIPIAQTDIFSNTLSYAVVESYLNNIFRNQNIKKIAYDIKTSMHILKKLNINIVNNYEDVMLKAFNINNTIDVSLNYLLERFLNINSFSKNDLSNTKEKKSIEENAKNSSVIVMEIGELDKVLSKLLKNDEASFRYYYDIELPVAYVVYKMEQNGVLVDIEKLSNLKTELENKLNVIKSNIYSLSKEEFNINSPKQVAEVLFINQAIPYPLKSKQGKYSTSEEILAQLSENYELPKLILEYRKLSKLINTYIDKLPQKVNSYTGRIHSRFNQIGTITGRFSSVDPNLQNIPVKTSDGESIRDAFVAPRGKAIISADYSQIELRIMAHLSHETNLINAFCLGRDIHSETASQMHNIPLSEVSQSLRRSAKAINFGLMYGMGHTKLAKQLGIAPSVAKWFIEKYFDKYPKVRCFIEKIKQSLVENEYVTTISGRRIFFKGYNSANKKEKSEMERAAINSPMQSSASEIIKKSMILIQKWIDSLNSDSIKIISQIHDELIFEVDAEKVYEYEKVISDIMSNVVLMTVPILVNVNHGSSWKEAH
ncbi:MAG: DNA polymerase I [Succinivibrionaceae bacterium]